MILLQVNFVGMTISELECNAPRTVHMNCVAGRFKTPQRVELRSGVVHVRCAPGLIEPVQQTQDAAFQAPVDPARPAFAPQLSQGFMLEGPDHLINVVELMTSVN